MAVDAEHRPLVRQAAPRPDPTTGLMISADAPFPEGASETGLVIVSHKLFTVGEPFAFRL
ncbi:MAG: hypothetical protein V4517_11340 [Pseudomonadota bacterium]